MALAQQAELLLKIYSVDHLLKCKMEEVSESMLRLSPLSGKVDMFQISDPVVLLFYEGAQLQMLPADVTDIDQSTGQVTFSRPKKETEEERRIFERYPISLIVSARRKFSNKRLHFLAKNISMYGMCVISQFELDDEELIDIDLITDKKMFYLSGKVIWKKAFGKKVEYGLQITHYDVATKQALEEHLEKQKAEYEKMITKAR